AEKEKEELKTKLENFQSSSKGLSKLLNSQMSATDKSELGYGSQIHDGVLSYENEVFASVFDSRISWVFFLRTKDETSGILKDFIRQIKNQLNQKVKTIRCDNGTEFKNRDIIEFCGSKGIKRKYSNARTPQQNRAEVVSTACYVLNRVLVTKPHNKIPYELLTGKFKEKSDEEFLVGYSLSCKAFRPITVENKANHVASPKETHNSAGTQDSFNAGNSKMEADNAQEFFVLPLWSSYTTTFKSTQAKNGGEKLNEDTDSKTNEKKTFAQTTKDLLFQAGAARASSTTYVNTASTLVNDASTPLNTASPPTNQDDLQIHALEDIYDHSKDEIFTSASYDDEGAVVDFTNLETTMNAIRTKWVYKNKNDERGVVVRNKARLVSQGHRQEEGINYDEVFAPVARIEAIRIFLAFSSYMGFIVYHMDVKSAFLCGKIDEEVYVSQPPRFIDPKFRNKVYKVVKALYGLHQAPRAWYATLSTFLVQSGYRRGLIDKTLFIKKDKKDIMLVQVYVDDIIFGSTKKSWCDEFEASMKNMFQMSSMGELTFFLGLQVKQKKMTVSTPIETKKPLVKDEEAADVDVHLYISMIGSLMYLTASRLDIMYAVCACSRFQVTPKTSHLQAVKRIFRYLKGQPKLGLWYPRESAFNLEAYSDSDYAGENLDRKSATGGCQFLGRRLFSWQCKKQTIVATSTTKAEYVDIARHHFIRDAYEKKLIQVLKINTDDNVADLLTKAFDKLCTAGTKVNTARLGLYGSTMFQNGYVDYIGSQTLNNEKQIHATVDSKAVVVTEASIRSSLLFNDADGTACLTNEEGEGSRAPIKPQPTPSPTYPSTGDQPPVTESSSSHDTAQDSRDSLKGTNGNKGDQVQSPYDSPLSSDHTSDRAESALNLEELFSICTNLSNMVLALETVKDAQAAEIISLKARIKKLEKRCKPSFSHHRAWLKSVQRLSITKRFRKKEFVSKQGRKKDKPEPTLDNSTLNDLDADHDMDTEELMDQGRLSEETEKLVSTSRPEDSTVRPDIGTADPIMKEEKAKEKGVSIKDIEDSSRPARSILTLKPLPTIDPKDKGKGVLEEPDPAKKITRRIKADALFAAKLQQEEREEYTIEESKKRVIDDFKPMDSDDAVKKEKVLEELDNTKIEVKQEGDEENTKKRPGRRLKMKATKKSKRQKTDSDLKEEEHLKTFMQIVPNEEGEVDYEVLDKRFPIINWESKFYHLDRHGVECIYYRMFRSDGSSRWIKTFSKMVTRFDRMDLEELCNLVMQRFETTTPKGVDLKEALLRFIQKKIDESGSHDRSEKDLTNQNQVDKTKKFLSSRFSMKDMGEANVILGIKIKRENKGIVITQSHYIEKILKKFNRKDCSPVSTHMDPVEKLKPNIRKPVYQLEYSRAIGCLMYAMTSTRLDIAYVVGRLSRFTSNLSRQHWKAITRVFKYLRGDEMLKSMLKLKFKNMLTRLEGVEKETDTQETDKNQAKNDKTKHKVEKIEKEKVIRSRKSKVKARAQNWKLPVCYDDDDDEEGSNSLKYKIISELPPHSAITPNEPVDSLSIGDEHLDTIPATESDEFIKSCVENLVPNPSESEGENGCDVLACFTTFSNILFDTEYESDSSDYQSCSDEDFSEEIFLNPLFKEEIIPMKIDQHHFNAESNLIESMLNHDSSIIPSSSKIDSLLDEFTGELTLLKSIPPRIDKTDCHPENEIRLTEILLYNNSSPRLPEEFVFKNSDADIESFSPSPILNDDSDTHMEEIDLTFTLDDPMPPGIEEDDDDSERDILIHEELLDNYSLSLPVNKSFHFDIPSFSRPPAKPPNGNTGILNIKMMGDVSDQKAPMPRLMITLASNQEKCPDLLSHRGLENFQLSDTCPMMIHGKNIPILDVPLFH
nr:retrovirus-related Pol polyprotein from transposon TNT 1-94 [Tanacetum cinerariifolium]